MTVYESWVYAYAYHISTKQVCDKTKKYPTTIICTFVPTYILVTLTMLSLSLMSWLWLVMLQWIKSVLLLKITFHVVKFFINLLIWLWFNMFVQVWKTLTLVRHTANQESILRKLNFHITTSLALQVVTYYLRLYI
jgi:hypothetical protein